MPQRVLLVDDSRSIRTLLKIYLWPAASSSWRRSPPRRACKVPKRSRGPHPHRLPHGRDERRGLRRADRASSNAKLSKVPILMMTGDPNVAEVRALGQKAGISAFVRKPVSCAQLMTLVDTILPLPRVAAK